jgi:hypothetical protein|tara:strand:+ start:2445 stop:2615 length:171 start_codon:yes stop_codon:yes gene_type:complete
MNIKEALQIVDEATQPVNAGKVSRSGYFAVEAALQLLKETLEKDGHLKEVAPNVQD